MILLKDDNSDKLLGRWVKKKENIQITKTKNEIGNTTDFLDINTIIRAYYNELNDNKLNNQDDIDILRKTYITKLTQEK